MDSRRSSKDKSYKDVFKGSLLVTHLTNNKSKFSDRSQAVMFAQRLLDLGHLESIVGSRIFEDSHHLFRWCDETVVKEAKRMISKSNSQIPSKKLIELVDLHQNNDPDLEKTYNVGEVKEKLFSDNQVILYNSRPRRQPTAANDSLSDGDEENSPVPETLDEDDSVLHDISSESSSDEEADEALRTLEDCQNSYKPDSDAPTPEHNHDIFESNPGKDNSLPAPLAEGEELHDGEEEESSLADSEEIEDKSEVRTCRYDGIEMPAIDIENIKFKAKQSHAVIQKSLEELGKQSNSYSDNEKQMLEQMKTMQHEHEKVVKSYEERINDMVKKIINMGGDLNKLDRFDGGEGDGDRLSLPNSPTPTAPPPAPPLPPNILEPFQKVVTPTKTAVKPRVKMRPLFWNRIILDKSSDSQIRSFWQSVTEPNFDVDEFERLFGREENEKQNSKSLHESIAHRRGMKKTRVEAMKVLEDNRSKAVGIKLRSMHCQMSDIQDAVYSMNFSKLDLESLYGLYEIRGTKEELDKIILQTQACDDVPLDQPEQFLLELSQMSHFPERIECMMLRKRFKETLFNIDQQLSSVQEACSVLRSNEYLKRVMELVLALGNYMNGGTQRGQADGFELSILVKLGDVKSMSQNMTLLLYIVRIMCTEYEKDAGKNDAKFRLPEIALCQIASSVSFAEVDSEINSLEHQLKTHAKKTELVCYDTEEHLLQPFKDSMQDFFDTADDMLKSQQKKLTSTKAHFQALLRILAVRDATEQVTPQSFFTLWTQFLEEYRAVWCLEQKRIARKMFDKVDQKKKDRIRIAKRRKSDMENGKENMKKKFTQLRRRGDSAIQQDIVRSQSVVGYISDGEHQRRVDGPQRRRQRPTSDTSYEQTAVNALGQNGHAPPRIRDSPRSESMVEKMQRRRRSKLKREENPAEKTREGASAHRQTLQAEAETTEPISSPSSRPARRREPPTDVPLPPPPTELSGRDRVHRRRRPSQPPNERSETPRRRDQLTNSMEELATASPTISVRLGSTSSINVLPNGPGRPASVEVTEQPMSAVIRRRQQSVDRLQGTECMLSDFAKFKPPRDRSPLPPSPSPAATPFNLIRATSPSPLSATSGHMSPELMSHKHHLMNGRVHAALADQKSSLATAAEAGDDDSRVYRNALRQVSRSRFSRRELSPGGHANRDS